MAAASVIATENSQAGPSAPSTEEFALSLEFNTALWFKEAVRRSADFKIAGVDTDRNTDLLMIAALKRRSDPPADSDAAVVDRHAPIDVLTESRAIDDAFELQLLL